MLNFRVNTLSSADIKFFITTVANHIAELVLEWQNTVSRSTEKVLVFAITLNDIAALESQLHQMSEKDPSICNGSEVLVYHSKLNKENKTENLSNWLESCASLHVMISTECLVSGIDSPNVRHLIIMGACRSTLDFWQAAGRTGRDGFVSFVSVYFHEYHYKRAQSLKEIEHDSEIYRFMKWANSNAKCFRLTLERTLGDFSQEDLSYKERKEVQYCSVCGNDEKILTRMMKMRIKSKV